MIVVIVGLNFFPVGAYAETEFWFASIKVFTIIGLLILAAILFFGGGPSHDPLYFSLWKDPGATNEYLISGAAGRFCALLYSMIYSAFSLYDDLVLFASHHYLLTRTFTVTLAPN